MAVDISAIVERARSAPPRDSGYDLNRRLQEIRARAGKFDLNTPEGLEQFSRAQGLSPPEEKRPFNALRKLGGVLNVGTATIAGGVRGLLRSDVSILEGAREGFKKRETFGFGDVIREDLGVQPEGRAGKAALGAVGFTADVLLDPLTYLTLGASAGSKSLRLGGKVLSKRGTKIAQQASKEVIESAIAKGIAREAAEQQAQATVKNIIDAASTDAITDDFITGLTNIGVTRGTASAVKNTGIKLIDRGGIKLAGRSIVTGERIAVSRFGRAGRAVRELPAIKKLSEPIGKLFVRDFQKNKTLVRILDQATIENKRVIRDIIEENKETFKGVSDDEALKFFEEVHKRKSQIVSDTKRIQDDAIQELKNLFPDLAIKTPDDARRVLQGLEDATEKQVAAIRKRIDEEVLPFFKERQRRIKETLELTTQAVSKGSDVGRRAPSLVNVDDLNDAIAALRGELKKLRKGVPVKAQRAFDLGEEVTGDELAALPFRLVASEEERLGNILDDLINQINTLKKKDGTKTTAAKVKKARLDAVELVALAERKILKLQNQLADKERGIQKILGARRAAKALQQKAPPLKFEEPRLQKLADAIFEGDDALVKQLARAAGIPEEDAIRFYIPSMSEDFLKKTGVKVSNLRPELGFLKEFRDLIPEEKLIKNPFELYTRRQVQVAGARIKREAAEKVVREIGLPIDEVTEEWASRNGYEKFSQKVLGGKVEGWLPKDVADDLKQFISPKDDPFTELWRALGLDWATGMFKGYVTSLFPAFHIRNITSNQFQNMVKIGTDVVNPVLQRNAVDLARGKNLDRIIQLKDGRRRTLGDIREEIMAQTDLLEEGAFGRFEQLLDEAKGDISGMINKATANPLSKDFALIQKGRDLGQFFERQAKATAILSSVMQGNTVGDGIRIAEEALFNYSKLTPFEKNVMRRIIPFYTFARKNAELQIRMLFENPGLIAAQMKAVRGASEIVGDPITEEDIDGLPSFILEGLGIKSGVNRFGQKTFLTGFGLPIEEFLRHFSGDKGIVQNTIADMLTQLNPVVKFPAERATERDFFRGRPITQIDNGRDLAFFFDMLEKSDRTKGVAAALREITEFKEHKEKPVFAGGEVVDTRTTYTANPFVLHFMRNLFTSRIQSTIGFLNDEEEATWNKLLRVFTGVRGWSIDQETQRYFNDVKRKRELEDFLIRNQVIRKFERNIEQQ